MSMEKKKRIVRLIILATLLNIFCFSGLYLISYHLTIVWLVLLLFFVPGLLNGALFQKALYQWELKKQMAVFSIMAVVTAACYGTFAYFFERTEGYENYILGNSCGIPKLYEWTAGRFFNGAQILFSFLFNLMFQLMICGTRKELTMEDIDRIFSGKKK